MKVLFYLSLIFIIWHNVLYSFFVIGLSYIIKNEKIYKDKDDLPTVSLLVAVHNEELIIEKKINNALSINYPKEKLEIIFASDNSTDKTNEIINEFSKKNENIKLIEIGERGGKVNAYNKAYKIAKGEILAFSDANTFWETNALSNLIQPLKRKDVACTCGHIIYTNEEESEIAFSESLYWKLENKIKEGESKIYSLTALNGGIYAIKREHYIEIDPLYSHDLCFPLLFAAQNKRTIFVKDALAFERSGTTKEDEVRRKRRMFGRIYSFVLKNPSYFFNPLKYPFRYFALVFSHRTLRYSLPFLHLILFLSNIFLFTRGNIYKDFFFLQIISVVFTVFYTSLKRKPKSMNIIPYYFLFLHSMLLGFFDFITGRIKPYWDLAKTTRR